MLEGARSSFAETGILQSTSAQRIIALDNSIMNSVRLLPETPAHSNELEHYVTTHKKIDCDVKQMLDTLVDYKASILSHAKLSKKAITEANQIETLIQSYRTICGASHENNFRAAVYIEKNPVERPIQAAPRDGVESDTNPAANITIFRGRSYRIQIETNPMITIATVINIQRVIGLSCAKSPKFMP